MAARVFGLRGSGAALVLRAREVLPSGSLARAIAAALAALAFIILLGQQEARLGPFPFPPLPRLWLTLGFVSAFLLVPSASPSRRGRELLGLAAVLAATAWPVHSWRRASVEPRAVLAGSVFRTSDPLPSREGVVPIHLADSKRRLPLHRLTGRTRDLALQISGYVVAPDEGSYVFALESDGPATLRIDGEVAVRSSRKASTEIQLEAGLHRLEIHYQRGAGRAFLDLGWNRPALFELLPLSHFVGASPGQLDASSIRAVERRSLATLLASFWWWTLAAVAVVRAGEGKRLRRGKLRVDSLAEDIATRGRRPPGDEPGLLALASFTLIPVVLLSLLAPAGTDEGFSRKTSSESMMQTVSVADLRDQPLRSIWFLHIQPPALDALRALLARTLATPDDEALLERVDSAMRGLWLLVHGALSAVMFLWLRSCIGTRPAALASLFFSLHPASLLYTTWLDSTLPTAASTLWFYYELFKASDGRGSTPRLIATALLLFFTRSIFQLPFLLVAALSLALVGMPRPRVAIFAAVVGLVAGLYVVKQYWLFGLVHTSSFAGYNGCRSIGADVGWNVAPSAKPLPPFPAASAALVLAREKKVNGEYNFNQLRYLEISFGLMERFQKTLLGQPLRETLSAYGKNLGIYLRPSSDYGETPVASGLPWRGLYDRLFSGGILLLLVSVAGGTWLLLRSASLRRGVGMAAPALYIVLVSVVFERGENMRFKFFVEPVVFVFCACQLHALGARVREGRR